MAANYLHGSETVEVQSGALTISTVRTGIIGLIGIAPTGDTNKPILVSNPTDAAAFGAQVPGFSIPQALDVIFTQGAGAAIVVNVFDPIAHTTQVTDESKTIQDGELKLAYAPIGDVTIKDADGDLVALQPGIDYTLDVYGNFTALSSAIAEGTVYKFSYKRLDETKITAADIIGSRDEDTDARTGTKCFELCYNMFGFNPKILIAPTFSAVTAVARELEALTDKYRAICYIDAPIGTTISNAVTGRGPLGSINFNTSSERSELLFPHLKRYDPATNSENALFPYSAFKAGVRAAVDINEGFWVSDSNKQIKGVTGVEVNISAAVNDPTTDTNRLNAAGITTVFNSFGTGVRTWGNRNASFPVNKGIKSFTVVRRVADMVGESIELASLASIDKPINQGLIDDVVESVNSYIRTLVQRGAVIDGACKFNPSDNPPSELEQGHLTFEYDLCPPPPAERMTFKQFVNISYLQTLK